MSQPGGPGSAVRLITIRRVGDIVVSDASSAVLNRIEAFQRWTEEMRQLIESMREKRLVLNLGGDAYLPGPLMHALLVLHRTAEKEKRRFAVCEVHPENFDAIRAARLHKVISFAEKEREAIVLVRAKTQK
ncbi:MAG: hypothetical protein IJG83_09360 [Thermoguttaceae bacterium]|nr:hypothetical protein [Thermoguttaceae bacterium]MBQ3333615.1 hypothetical protein [Thermoguttaceae bacterium]MBQ6619373.1 hypothetical protein [Thermoguttaceae bacterium]